MMKRIHGILAASAVAAIVAVSMISVGRADSNNERTIQASDLIRNSVIGILGQRLGERQIIVAIFGENVMLANPLSVREVNGKALPQVIKIESTGITKLKAGVTYKLEGYESGAFSGPPSWVAPEAQQNFSYHPIFIVTRVLEPKEQSE